MDAKLTLKLDREIIEKAKQYTKEKNISLSKLIENMLRMVTSGKNVNPEITPLVKSLSGVLSSSDISNNDYINYLEEKYK